MVKKKLKVIWSSKKREQVGFLIEKKKRELEKDFKNLKSKDKKGARGERIQCHITQMKLLLCILGQDEEWLIQNTYLFVDFL